MSRPLKDEKALCSDISTFINVAKSYQQQKRIVAKAQAQASRTDDAHEPRRGGTDKQRGSVWIVLKGGFSAPNASAKRQEDRRGFRERLRATKRERDALLEAAEDQGMSAEVGDVAEDEAEDPANDEVPAELETADAVEEAETEAEPPIAPTALWAPSKVPGEAFFDFVQRHGATVDSEGGIDQSEPTRCIVRVRSSRPLTAARTLPPANSAEAARHSDPSDLKSAKKRRREAARKRRVRSVRGLHRKSTTVLGSQKAVNYFKTNLLQILKREVQPFMAKALAAPPAISSIPFSDVAPKEAPPAAPAQKSQGEKQRAEPHPPKEAPKGKEVPPLKEAPKTVPPASGKTKAQLKAEQSVKQASPPPNSTAKKGNAKKK